METTCSTRAMEKMTGSQMFKIMGYSLDKNIGKDNVIESGIFNVGGHDWSIRYYPNGSNQTADDDISIYLHLKNNLKGVKAQVNFTILDQNGCALHLSKTTCIYNFGNLHWIWGFPSFCKRAELESNFKDDCFVIKSMVIVFKVFPVESSTAQVVVPSGIIQQQIGHLFDNGFGADVTFEVDEQTFSAHKCILAARSPVFLAQFFGAMKEKSDTTIKIKKMEAPVFKAMLHYIYSDSFPEFEEKKKTYKEHDTILMAEHLLVAADRYGLERLKIICEKMLCGSLDKRNVVTLMSLAERHICNHLKTACLKFSASFELLGAEAKEQF